MNRKEQIRNKARELGQTYFPDSANIWARSNVEAVYVENACVEMAEWLDQYPNWIPVEEKLPEENQRVRAWSLENNEEYLCDYHDGIFEDFYGQFTDGKITHWMEIVPPGKEE